jgi:hypothetical protein
MSGGTLNWLSGAATLARKTMRRMNPGDLGRFEEPILCLQERTKGTQPEKDQRRGTGAVNPLRRRSESGPRVPKRRLIGPGWSPPPPVDAGEGEVD